MFEKAYKVIDVRLTILKTRPLTLRIVATGESQPREETEIVVP